MNVVGYVDAWFRCNYSLANNTDILTRAFLCDVDVYGELLTCLTRISTLRRYEYSLSQTGIRSFVASLPVSR